MADVILEPESGWKGEFETAPGGQLGRSPYHVAERYSRGEISRVQVIDSLTHWAYLPTVPATQGLHDDLLTYVPGSFDDVEAALLDELIDEKIYTAALNGLTGRSAKNASDADIK